MIKPTPPMILSTDNIYSAVVLYGAVAGGVSTTPAEIGSTLPKVPVLRNQAFEHPVLPSTPLGRPSVMPRTPTNGSNLLTAIPL